MLVYYILPDPNINTVLYIYIYTIYRKVELKFRSSINDIHDQTHWPKYYFRPYISAIQKFHYFERILFNFKSHEIIWSI